MNKVTINIIVICYSFLILCFRLIINFFNFSFIYHLNNLLFKALGL